MMLRFFTAAFATLLLPAVAWAQPASSTAATVKTLLDARMTHFSEFKKAQTKAATEHDPAFWSTNEPLSALGLDCTIFGRSPAHNTMACGSDPLSVIPQAQAQMIFDELKGALKDTASGWVWFKHDDGAGILEIYGGPVKGQYLVELELWSIGDFGDIVQINFSDDPYDVDGVEQTQL